MNRVLFSRVTDEWATPTATYDALNAEFGFADDACPLGGDANGLLREWKSPCFCKHNCLSCRRLNGRLSPSTGRSRSTADLLVPSRTDTRWWHNYAMKASEIRFIRGRLKFGQAKTGAPFPSCVVIFRGAQP